MKKGYIQRFSEFLFTQKYTILFSDQFPYCIDYITNVEMQYIRICDNQIKILEKFLEMLSILYKIPLAHIWAEYHDYNYDKNIGKIHKYSSSDFLEYCKAFEDHVKNTKGIIWPRK